MNNDIEKELWAKLVDFVEFVIRSAAKENLEDLEFGVAYMLQTAKSAGMPTEVLSILADVVPEVYEKLKAERDATKLQ
ncbi:hypothetical protein P7H16_01775 [Paenibacillus larvae]|nr:hypothetical protein [Paenibacillus larvae]MDT2245998.1 hypothetical protein [Paenibacillus larvae]MDT2259617.1 hypothetical protein [Paenibacillus larvae]MDT2275129.1 hypothetical protein [Paenibacillus larvae]